jgi:regulation of enolase protein 1 (concanavalin A-like superfamily)
LASLPFIWVLKMKPFIVFIVLVFSTAGPPAGSAQDASEGGVWGRPVNADDTCQIAVSGGQVKISIARGPRDLSAELNVTDAPRVMREVTGDFIIQVRVAPDFRLRGQSTITGRPVFCSAGLLLWSSETDYVRLERAMYVQPQKPVVDYMSFDRRKAGKWIVNRDRPPVNRSAESWHLRLERLGDSVTGAISEDGEQWSSSQTIQIPDFPNKLLVGVAVCSTSKAPIAATFDSLEFQSLE